jgi:threonine dehydratase
VHETPLEPSAYFSERVGAAVLLKLENLQVTGSFKARGAFNKLLSLAPSELARGIVAASTGNHGAAIAYSAMRLGLSAVVFVPENASPAKVENIRRFGASIIAHGAEGSVTETFARAYAAERGMTYASPYNDAEVIGGQGTMGAEIASRMPDVDAVVVPLGGGGMISGIAGYLKAIRPDVRIVAASPRNSMSMIESVRAGTIVETKHLPTLSDGTAGGVEPGSITFELCRSLVDDFVVVEESTIAQAMKAFIETHHMLCEGSAGVALAALDSLRGRGFKNVAAVVSGANISAATLKSAL